MNAARLCKHSAVAAVPVDMVLPSTIPTWSKTACCCIYLKLQVPSNVHCHDTRKLCRITLIVRPTSALHCASSHSHCHSRSLRFWPLTLPHKTTTKLASIIETCSALLGLNMRHFKDCLSSTHDSICSVRNSCLILLWPVLSSTSQVLCFLCRL